MKPYDGWKRSRIEVATNRIANGIAQSIHTLRLGMNRMSEGVGFKAALKRFLNRKNDLLIHIRL